FSVFCLFAFASGFSADSFADFNNPDAMITMMKTMVIPMMKNEYEQLDHEKMHEDMKEDNIQMNFVDRGFDFCVGEEVEKMSFEEDRKCSEKISEMIIDHVPDLISTDQISTFAEQEDEDLMNQLNELFDVDGDGHFSRSESKEVVYCYLRIGFQKLIDFGIIQDDISTAISSLATTIPEIMNSDEAKSYFDDHRRLYQTFQTRFNKVRLENLFKNVDATSRGITKLVVKLMNEFSDFAAEVYHDY
ncbi:unnamed protein product, partial [Oikopleura dioica]